MRSARSALYWVFAAYSVHSLSAMAQDAGDTRIAIDGSDDIRVVCIRWSADAQSPLSYDPTEDGGCAAAGPTNAATDPPETKALERLDHAIAQLQADIDAFRLTTESADPAPLRWQITAAGPNHLYYAAHTLLRNTSVGGRSTQGTCLASGAEKNAATLDVVVDVVMCVNNQISHEEYSGRGI